MSGFRVLPYSINSLLDLLSEKSGASIETVSRKAHKSYFDGYFSHLKAQTVVVEEEYIDHDYLEDYSAYYVKCFAPYSRFAARLHFFKNSFDTDAFQQLLADGQGTLSCELLQDNYLGFIVVKPLPQTIVGRTCLTTYESANRRRFPIVQRYDANLFGIPLHVDTIAFQEQDSVVAACATSALWSCFHATGKLFHHSILSPVEITKAASVNLPNLETPMDVRTLPNHGLTATQMAYAVKHVGLEPFIVNATNRHILDSTIYAYAQCQIPTVLVIQLQSNVAGNIRVMGSHAVTVTGFSLGLPSPIPEATTGFLLRASTVDKFYVHDDQVGPFARMEHQMGSSALTTSWPGPSPIEAVPIVMIVPLYHKIRIPFSLIHDTVLQFDAILNSVVQAVGLTIGRFEWDVYLTTINAFKVDLFPSRGNCQSAQHVLTLNLPRYMWRATAYMGGTRHLDFLFDATGIEQAPLCSALVEYDPTIGELARPIRAAMEGGILNLNSAAHQVIEMFRKFS